MKNHYDFKDYVTLSRWDSYYEQINAVLALKPVNILEIGLGTKLVYAVLKDMGFQVIGFDNDPQLEPDFLGDITKLDDFFKEGQFDCVCCFQVLEHLPFSEFENTIKKICKISSKYVLISLPYAGFGVGMEIFCARRGEKRLSFDFRIPKLWVKHRYIGMHHWEPGYHGYSLRKIKKILLNHFEIKQIKFSIPSKTGIMFILKKKYDK